MILGPRPLPYFPSKCASPLFEVCFRESPENSESISQEWQSAPISKLEDSGRISVMGDEEFVISMSSLGGVGNRTSMLPLRFSTFTLPPGFSLEISEKVLRNAR